MKKIIILALLSMLLFACEKDNNSVKVTYKVSNAFASTSVNYRNVSGSLINESINFASSEDIWLHSFEIDRGEIVYLSAQYLDSLSSVKLQIIVDGKVFKEGSSNNEPQKFVTVSGSIPYLD
jgi:hypothetical protein